MESEAALRALIDRIEREFHRDGPCVLSNADVRDILTTLATLADLRARLAAVEGERDAAQRVCESAKLEHRKVSGMWMAERQRAIAAEQQRDTARAVLAAIKRDPHGCPFCDSGVLRGPKPHDPACGFALLNAALSAPEGKA